MNQKSSSPKNKGTAFSVFLIILSGCLWGTTGLYVRKLTSAGLDSFQIALFRCFFAFLLFLGVILIKDRSLLRIKLKDIWCFLGTGVASLTVFNICYFTTINLTSLSVAAVLLYTEPAIVMLLSYPLFHEKLNMQKIGALVLTLVGYVFVTGILTDSPTISMVGLLWGIGAGIGYALYSIFSRYAFNRGYRSLTVNVYTFLFSTLSLIPISKPGQLFTIIGNGQMPWLWACLIALFSSFFPYLLYTIGLTKVENGKAAIFASTEPVMATLISVIVFKESMSVFTALGVLLVLGAIVLLNIKWPKKNSPPKD